MTSISSNAPQVRKVLAKCARAEPISRAEADLLRRAGLRKDGQPIQHRGRSADTITIDAVRAVVDTLGVVDGFERLFAKHGERVRVPLRNYVSRLPAGDRAAALKTYEIFFPRRHPPTTHSHKVNVDGRVTIRVGALARPGDRVTVFVAGDELRIRREAQ